MKKARSDKRTFFLSFIATVTVLGFFAAMFMTDGIIRSVTGETTSAFSVRRSGPDVTSVTVFGNSLFISDQVFKPVIRFIEYEGRFLDQLLPDELQYAAAGTHSLLSTVGKKLGTLASDAIG